MSKIRTDPHVKVTPTVYSWVSSDPQKRRVSLERFCEDIVEQIKRHVDGIDEVEIAYNEICEFCGELWNEEASGRPRCCDEAIDEWEMLRRVFNDKQP